MKKSNFVMLLMVALISYLPTQTTATSLPAIIAKTQLVQQKIIQVTLANLQKNTTKVQITDVKGKKIFFEETIRNHNGFSKKMNLEKLPLGTYIIAVKHEGKLLRQVIRVMSDQIYFSKFR